MLDGMKARMIENLELSSDQVKSVEMIIDEIKDEIPYMRENLQEIQKDFSRQFASDTFDQEVIKSTLEKKVVDYYDCM